MYVSMVVRELSDDQSAQLVNALGEGAIRSCKFSRPQRSRAHRSKHLDVIQQRRRGLVSDETVVVIGSALEIAIADNLLSVGNPPCS
jgi:hypothetical protein